MKLMPKGMFEIIQNSKILKDNLAALSLPCKFYWSDTECDFDFGSKAYSGSLQYVGMDRTPKDDTCLSTICILIETGKTETGKTETDEKEKDKKYEIF
jgi:hypothetical protein